MSISNELRGLVALEKEALARQRQHDYEGAARLWECLLEKDPDWEHGIAQYCLAQCYETLNRLAEAERLFRAAVQREPSLVHLGGYASFLFEHSDNVQKAWEVFLQTIQLETKQVPNRIGSTEPLRVLGRRLGLSESEITQRIDAAIEAGRRGELPEIVEKWPDVVVP